MALVLCNFTEWQTLSDRIDRIFANSVKIHLSAEYYEIARRIFCLVRWSIHQAEFQYLSPSVFAEFTRMLQNIKYTIDTFQPLGVQLAEHVLSYITRLVGIIEHSHTTQHAMPQGIIHHARDAAIAAALSAAGMFERYMAAEDGRIYDMCDSNDSADCVSPSQL